MNSTLPEACDRARQHISLDLDSELSEFEEVLLESHLRDCACCQAYADDLEVVTEILRRTRVAQPRGRFHVPVGSGRNDLLHWATRLRSPRLPAGIGMARVVKVAATVAVAVVAFGVVSNPQAPDTMVGALEVQTAHERISVKEKILDQLESSEATQARQISNGLQSRGGEYATAHPRP